MKNKASIIGLINALNNGYLQGKIDGKLYAYMVESIIVLNKEKLSKKIFEFSNFLAQYSPDNGEPGLYNNEDLVKEINELNKLLENNKSAFIKNIDRYLKQKGFTKKGVTWTKKVSNYFILFNLQGSQYRGSFYLNIGIYTSLINGSNIMKVYNWDLHTRYESMFGLDNKELLRLFNYDTNLEEIEKNTGTITKNLNLCLDILEKLGDAGFIMNNIDELRKSFNLSHFNRGKFLKIIKLRKKNEK